MLEVYLTQRAQTELDQAHRWWADHRSPEQADRWYSGFIRAMLDLENDPQRWPLAHENEILPIKVRQLNFGLGGKATHRALFTIRPEKVVILRVRHLARRPLSADDI